MDIETIGDEDECKVTTQLDFCSEMKTLLYIMDKCSYWRQ